MNVFSQVSDEMFLLALGLEAGLVSLEARQVEQDLFRSCRVLANYDMLK